jgi:hypothetical protein
MKRSELKQIIKEEIHKVLNENLDLNVGSHYHWEDKNSAGEDTSTDYEYVGTEGNHVIFKVLKSYMDDAVKLKYKKQGLEHFYTPGGRARTTKAAVNRAFNFGKFNKI